MQYKTPQERALLNASVPVGDRLKITEERKLYEDSELSLKLNPRFSQDSRTYSIVSSLAFFFGSPVGAELGEQGGIEYARTSKGLIRWRVDEFFKAATINDVLIAICEAVLSSEDDSLIQRVHKQIKDSQAIGDARTKTANTFFAKWYEYRDATKEMRDGEALAAAFAKAQHMSPELRAQLAEQLLSTSADRPGKSK